MNLLHGDCLELLPTLDAEYIEIARRRIEHWSKQPVSML